MECSERIRNLGTRLTVQRFDIGEVSFSGNTKLLICGLFQKGRVLAQDGMVLLGRNALERALREYRLHYLSERNHQGLGNRLLEDFPQDADGPSVECRERLGGLLRYYYRGAA